MGEVMAALLVVVDAWFEVATEAAPERFQPSDRVEVLGQLVRLVSHRFRGFKQLPESDDVAPVITADSVGLRVRSPSPVPNGTQDVERQLEHFGFVVQTVAGTGRREIVAHCECLARATVLPFPGNDTTAAER